MIRAGLSEVTVDQRLEGSEAFEPCRYLGEEFPRQGKAPRQHAWCAGVTVRRPAEVEQKRSGWSEVRDIKGHSTAMELTDQSRDLCFYSE